MTIDWENLGRTNAAPEKVFVPKRAKNGKRTLDNVEVKVMQVHWRKAIDDLLSVYRTGETSKFLGMGRTYLYYVESNPDSDWEPSAKLANRILALYAATFGVEKTAELLYIEKLSKEGESHED